MQSSAELLTFECPLGIGGRQGSGASNRYPEPWAMPADGTHRLVSLWLDGQPALRATSLAA